jgi:hypothetical protein
VATDRTHEETMVTIHIKVVVDWFTIVKLIVALALLLSL